MQEFDYRDPSSIPKKAQLMHRMFGKAVPDILFYNIQNSRISRKDELMIGVVAFSTALDESYFGELFVYVFDPSKSQPPRNLRRFNVLCITNAVMIPFMLTLEDGQVCHLLQAGSKNGKDGFVNFMDLWGPSPQDPVGEVDLSGLNVSVVVMTHGEGGLVPTGGFNNFPPANARTPEPKNPSPSEPLHKSWFARMIAWILGTG